jgi:hypothetical protein
LNLQDYSTIWNGKKQEKNDTKINYFRRLTKFTFYEIINISSTEKSSWCLWFNFGNTGNDERKPNAYFGNRWNGLYRAERREEVGVHGKEGGCCFPAAGSISHGD